MDQSTKLFVVLGFMFIVFTTLNGHLEKYLRVLFANCNAPSSGGAGGFIGSVVKGASSAAKTVSQVGEAAAMISGG